MSQLCGNCFFEVTVPEAAHCPRCGYALGAGPLPDALPVGSILNGHYIVGRPLGQGGFGITYKALDHNTGDVVAVKEYFPSSLCRRSTGASTLAVTATSRELVEDFYYGKGQFLEEAETLAGLGDIPGIVRVHEYFEENGTAYFSMDYVDGTDLKDYLHQHGGRLRWEELRGIVYPIMDALQQVHDRGVIHRDISPDNIYVRQSGDSVLLDFGAAKASLGEKSQSLSVILKHGYAPKEQYYSHGKQGPWTDVYAMGATIYRCLTGERPPESLERSEAIAEGRPDPLKPISAYASVPKGVEAAVSKAMAVETRDRYWTMVGFELDLRASDAGVDTSGSAQQAPADTSGSQAQAAVAPTPEPDPQAEPGPSDEDGGRGQKGKGKQADGYERAGRVVGGLAGAAIGKQIEKSKIKHKRLVMVAAMVGLVVVVILGRAAINSASYSNHNTGTLTTNTLDTGNILDTSNTSNVITTTVADYDGVWALSRFEPSDSTNSDLQSEATTLAAYVRDGNIGMFLDVSGSDATLYVCEASGDIEESPGTISVVGSSAHISYDDGTSDDLEMDGSGDIKAQIDYDEYGGYIDYVFVKSSQDVDDLVNPFRWSGDWALTSIRAADTSDSSASATAEQYESYVTNKLLGEFLHVQGDEVTLYTCYQGNDPETSNGTANFYGSTIMNVTWEDAGVERLEMGDGEITVPAEIDDSDLLLVFERSDTSAADLADAF